ncbi:hypothetical protein ACFWUP_04400 [Nocardia sp. NPDC058658]|uniref:hypothetical protein n=1 Tax=Nocardia sp. NPDC058658 TaxID=3346580 RepID=UPI00364C88AD
MRSDISRTARLNKGTVLRDAEAIETLLASPQPPGTLSWMVAAHGNWALQDETSDDEAALWLRGLAKPFATSSVISTRIIFDAQGHRDE